MVRSVPKRSPRHWLLTLFAMIAMLGQATVALSPLAEGRPGRMATHVEASGSATHFVHDETKCVSCQARSMYSAPARQIQPPIRLAISARAAITHVGLAPAAYTLHQSSPRAPPV